MIVFVLCLILVVSVASSCERCSIPQLTRAVWCWCHRHSQREFRLPSGRLGDAEHGEHSPSHPSSWDVQAATAQGSSRGQPAFGMQAVATGTELWRGGRRCVWRRLCHVHPGGDEEYKLK